ncbi:MAG: hypothetical protein C4522_13405 [Desulfobacteraceae bacterium]|nr:MAG: hypothetical protein C4522_13405 [Desulfobacteraceae bacterium]
MMNIKPGRKTDRLFDSNILLTGLALAAYLIVFYTFSSVLFDDIFVSLRYAKNMADGFGPTFSKGVPPVEGYSNTLLVWMVVVFIKMGIDPLFAVKIISLFAGGTVIILISQLLKHFELHFIARLTAVFSLVFCIPYSYWLGSGTENGLYSLFLVAAVYMSILQKKLGLQFITVLVCLCLIRPEGVAFSLLILGLRFLFSGEERPFFEFFRNTILFSVICLALLIWRYTTFGELLPNTYYAKTGGSLLINAQNSVSIIRLGMQTFGLPMTVLMVIGFFSVMKQKRLLIPMCVLISGMAFVVYTGGDVNVPRLRFFVLYVPIMSVFAGFGLERISAWIPFRQLTFAAFVLIAINILLSYRASLPTYLDQTWKSGSTFNGHITLSKSLQKKVPEGTTIALWDIGIIPYKLNHCRIIDLTGITDSFISRTEGGHFQRNTKPVVDYVFEKTPDLMILNTIKTSGTGIFPEYPVIGAITSDSRFKKNYKIAQIQHTIGPYYLAVFQRSPISK